MEEFRSFHFNVVISVKYALEKYAIRYTAFMTGSDIKNDRLYILYIRHNTIQMPILFILDSPYSTKTCRSFQRTIYYTRKNTLRNHPTSFLPMYPVVVSCRKLCGPIMVMIIVVSRLVLGVVAHRTASVANSRPVLRIIIKIVLSRRERSVVLMIVILLGSEGIRVVVVNLTVAALATVIVSISAEIGFVVIHVNPLIRFIIVGGHGKGGLVWVNVFAASTANLAVFVARQATVKVRVGQGVGRDKSGCSKKETRNCE